MNLLDDSDTFQYCMDPQRKSCASWLDAASSTPKYGKSLKEEKKIYSTDHKNAPQSVRSPNQST